MRKIQDATEFIKNKWNDNPEKGGIDAFMLVRDLKLKNSERFAQNQFY